MNYSTGTYKTAPLGSQFEDDVLRVLRLLGYVVQKNVTIAGCQIDIYGEYKTGVIPLRIMVECKDYSHQRTVSIEEVRGFSGILLPVRGKIVDKGLLVARSGFTRQAKELADEAGITLVTFLDLANQLVDFEPYLSRVIQEFESSPSVKYYINLPFSETEDYLGDDNKLIHCALDDTDRKVLEQEHDDSLDSLKTVATLDDAVRKVLEQESKGRLALLGNFGTGKSMWCRKFARDSALLHFQDRTRRIPVVIPLSDYEAKLDIQQLVTNTLQFRYGVRIDLTLCQELQRLGRFLFLFDGFDEMATRVDPEVIRENLREVNKIARIPENIFIITCRTHFFRDRVQAEILADFSMLFIPEWGEAELREYLHKRFGSGWENHLDRINNTHNLTELAQTPLFLNMIAETLPKLGSEVRRTQLYQAYTENWLQEQTLRRGARLSSYDRQAFVSELALTLYREGRTACHYSEFAPLIKRRFAVEDAAQMDYLQSDVRNCTFLTRTSGGTYGFQHKSFFEYFVAVALSHELAEGLAEHIKLKPLPLEIRGFLAEIIEINPPIDLLRNWAADSSPSALRENAYSLLIDLRIRVPEVTVFPKTKADEERALWVDFLYGDMEAFDKLARLYLPLIKDFLRKRGLDDNSAKEVASNTLIKILESRERFNPSKGNLKGYVLKIAENLVWDHCRLAKRSRSDESLTDALSRPKSYEPITDAIASEYYYLDSDIIDPYSPSIPTTEADDRAEELAGMVQQALSSLDVNERQVIEQFFFEGKSSSEIARRLGISFQLVNALKRKAICKLKINLSKSL